MRAREITESTQAQTVLKYVKSIHDDFHLDDEILKHPNWRLAAVPLNSLHVPDPESNVDAQDPYDRVQYIDMYHVDEIKAKDIERKPIVVDSNGHILDGNHRAVAARLMGMKTIPAWVPEKSIEEQRASMKFLRPGELQGSFTDADMIRMGFRRAQNGAWYISQARWNALIAAGKLREDAASTIEYKLSTPNKIDAATLDALAQLIATGSEVDGNMVQRNLRAAASIAWAADGDEPVGVIALKRPQSSYQTAVFQKAGVPNLANSYNLELGYVYVKPEYRSRGVSAQLLRTMNRSINTPVFATTRANNRAINAILRWAGFEVTGEPYNSARGDYKLMLWTRGGVVSENFADGKKPGRKGLAKRMGVNCKQSVSKLRKIAKSSSGEKQRMAHWCANMKAGKKK